MTTTGTVRRPAGPDRSTVVLVGVLAAIAVGGGLLGARALVAGTRAAPAAVAEEAAGLRPIHTDVVTSFGAVAVEVLEKNARVPGAGDAGMLDVRATVSVRNSLDRPLRATTDQFALVASGRRHAPARATATGVTVRPGALVDEVLGFVVPRRGEQMVLEFADPSSATPIRIDLGHARTGVRNPDGRLR